MVAYCGRASTVAIIAGGVSSPPPPKSLLGCTESRPTNPPYNRDTRPTDGQLTVACSSHFRGSNHTVQYYGVSSGVLACVRFLASMISMPPRTDAFLLTEWKNDAIHA